MANNIKLLLALGMVLGSFARAHADVESLSVDDLNLIDENVLALDGGTSNPHGGGGNHGGGNHGGGNHGGGNHGGGNHGGGNHGGGNHGGGNHGGGNHGGGNHGGGNHGGGNHGGHGGYGGHHGGYGGYGGYGSYGGGYGTTVAAPTCWMTANPVTVYVGDVIDLQLQISGTYYSATIDNYQIATPVGSLRVRPDRPGTFTSVGQVNGPGGSRSCSVSYSAVPRP